jgi:hypothetical protein
VNNLKENLCNGPESELLPWYVNETLEDHELERVHVHLESCEDCQQDLELLSRLQNAVRTESLSPLVPAPRDDELLAALDRSGQRDGLRHRWQWLAAAAAAILAVGAAVIMMAPSVSPSDAPTRFETATSSPTINAINFVVELKFESGIDEPSRSEFFSEIEAVDRPIRLDERIYRLTLAPGSLSLSDLEVYIEGIRSMPEVSAVDVVAVQLPVE